MEASFSIIADHVALMLEALVVLAVSVGAIETVLVIGRCVVAHGTLIGARRDIWMRFARWLMLALEFALAADIVRTAIAPTWDDIGQLGAIALIRTVLGLFLERDIDAVDKPSADRGRPAS